MINLETPVKLRNLQRTLYGKAKAEPGFRFYLLYDKVFRDDILAHAYDLARHNDGAPGVDGQSFAQIELAGREGWLSGLREELRTKTYRAQPVRRGMIPKQGGGERALGIPARLRLDVVTPDMIRPNAANYVRNGQRYRAELRRVEGRQVVAEGRRRPVAAAWTGQNVTRASSARPKLWAIPPATPSTERSPTRPARWTSPP